MATIQKRPRKGGTSYRVMIRVKTPTDWVEESKTFRRKGDASEWARQRELELRRGDNQRPTLKTSDLINRWRQDCLPQIKTEKDRASRGRMLDWWSKNLGSLPADSIASATVLKQLEELERGKGPSGRKVSKPTRNRYLAALGACFSHAVRQGLLPRACVPTAGLRARENKGRERWLSDDERERLLDAVHGTGRLELAVLIALATGARKGEIVGLRWGDVELERGLIYLTDTKNGRSRALPLLPKAHALLKEESRIRRIDDDRIFRSPRANSATFPEKQWRRALKRAEIEDFRFHDLRHTAGSWMAQQGFSLREIADLLGHETLQMVQRYSHFAQGQTAERLRQAMLDRGAEG